ncbi:DMT family transporter [Clostridium cylindrosporum]|uniref:Permease of the drug/metabolite transporter (DMT) superfamily n=1 Tax=Clostridium cylindrosporum DSM 605 TaxID=1121307 RepID=A0A0J8D4X6_CLOCY|nr:DMT family transporter [Clostridium cylindrosporum]KMT20872.1 permease of the drug/metabolite transporter (DMT) superfamily [Clostridium cylindrosporum DSM 605]
MNIENKSLAADISLLVVAFLWGGGFIATKYALESITPNYINFIRFLMAFVAIALIFHKKIGSIDKSSLKAGAIIGLFLYVGFILQTIGLQYTTAGKQAFLTGTNVVIVPFLYWIVRGKKPDRYNIFAAIIAVVGIGFLSLNENFSINFGDTLTIICALFFAGHIVSIACFATKYDPIVLTIVQFGTVTILSLISSLMFEPAPKFTSTSTLGILYLGIFSTLICFAIQNVAQKYTLPDHAAIILCLESVFGSLLSTLVLGEEFTFKMIIGSAAIFLAITTAETKWGFLKKKSSKLIRSN